MLFKNTPPRISRNQYFACIISLCLILLIFLFFSPHTKISQDLTWSSQSLSTESDVTWNDVLYDSVTNITLAEDLPRGSYDLKITVENASDDDVLRVTGIHELSSIYSSLVSCSLSQYGTEYTISFENYHSGNTLFLSLYQQNASSLDVITGLHLQSSSLMTWQLFGICLLILVLFQAIILLWDRLDRHKWAAILLTAAIASIPLFTGYIFYGHDTLFHLSRVEGLKDGLLSGQFPVRISAEQFNQYGYISSALYPELLLYFPAVLRLFNIPMTATYCIFWFCIHVLTAYIAWNSFHGITGSRISAYAGMVLFTLLPYRLLSVYLRGAYGEALAMTFFPLVLWGVYEIFYGDYHKWPLAVIGYSGVLQCHILTITSTVIFSVIWGLCNFRVLWKEKHRILCVLALIGSVFFLNLWFLIPFLMLYRLPLWVKYINGAFLEHVLYVRQLFSIILKGTGNSYPLSAGTADEMSFSIGLGLILGLGMILYCLLRKKWKQTRQRNLCLGCLVISVFFYWTTTVWFPWTQLQKILPFLSSFTSNLPWRRLGTAGVFLTASVVAALQCFDSSKQKILLVILIIGTLISSGSFMISYTTVNEPYITSSEDYGKGSEDELYLYFGTDIEALKSRGNYVNISSDCVVIEEYEKQFTNLTLHYENTSVSEEWIDLPLNYYPGYVAVDENGHSLSVIEGENHVVRVILPADSSSVIQVSYRNCNLYRAATIVSLIYTAVFAAYILRRRRLYQKGSLG